MTAGADEVMVFVRRGTEWLVLRRSPRQGAYWHCVAGGVEHGETDLEAAARELREEVGLEADPVDLHRRFAYVPEAWEPRSRDGAGPFRVACFLVDAQEGWEPELDWEHDGYRWCARDEAVELLRWPEPRAVLAEIA
jgi:8-oxo-dGTP pyrophosphatase MutT (NUDIX family)